MNDEFYIGWQDQAPSHTARTIRRACTALILLALGAALTVAWSQRMIGRAVFEWGQAKEFSGVLQARPAPHLLVKDSVSGSPAVHWLVNPWKFGFDPAIAREFDGQRVTLRGTRIHRDDQQMIEVERGSVTRSAPAEPGNRADDSPAASVALGERTFLGEIVDSKCYLGVMNPGRLKPHRACAVRCISGGVPPLLLVRQPDGSALCLLLVSHNGEPVNQQVLGLVAEPLRITGELVREGDLLTLRSDPATYQRVR